MSGSLSHFVTAVHFDRWQVSKCEPYACSQKRKSEDVNGEAANGQTEVKKEDDDDAEEVNIKIFKVHSVSVPRSVDF